MGGAFFTIGVLSLRYIIRFVSCLWFLVALFVGKQIYYFVRKIGNRKQIVVLLMLYFVGALLGTKGIFNNYYWFKQAWVFSLFLYIGEQYKKQKIQT